MLIGMYNLIPPQPLGSHAFDALCAIPFVKEICRDIERIVLDPEIWNLDRIPTAASMVPSGTSYRTFVYYAQMVNDGRFSLYDYGTSMNRQIYGSDLAPLVPI